jgi:hypothetical protein
MALASSVEVAEIERILLDLSGILGSGSLCANLALDNQN